MVEQAAREAVAEVDNRRREGEGDDGNEGLEDDEADGEDQGDVLADVEARQEGYMERHTALGLVKTGRAQKQLKQRQDASRTTHRPSVRAGLGKVTARAPAPLELRSSLA